VSTINIIQLGVGMRLGSDANAH